MKFTRTVFSSLLTAVLATALMPHAVAATLELAGVKIEDTLNIYNNTLLLNGAGVVSNGKVPQYVAHIYAKQKFTALDQLTSMPGPKRLTLVAIRDVDTAPIAKLLIRNVESNAARNDTSKLVPGLMNIGEIFKNNRVLRAGEVMTLDWIPISGLVIYVGGKMQGQPQREPEFVRAAMGVWLGDNPIDVPLKAALFGRP